MRRTTSDFRATPAPRYAGWSFIEIMVALAIVAILLTLAVPSYRQYLQRGHRAEAVRTLLQVAACQERVRAATGRYDTTRCIVQPQGDGYRISLEPADVTRSLVYQAIATPAHSTPPDDCGALRIDQAGRRSIEGPAARLGNCWGGR